jgi:hypothetical protein
MAAGQQREHTAQPQVERQTRDGVVIEKESGNADGKWMECSRR